MAFKTLLQPALFVMSKLSFKTKIITSILLLFILLLLPSRTLFTDYIDKNERYEKQLVGLQYIAIFNAFIKTVQTHRTLSLEYLENNSSENKHKLYENEKKFYGQRDSTMDFDQEHYKLLNSNQNFAKAVASFEIIQVENFDQLSSKQSLYNIHGEIISKLAKAIYDVSLATSFASSKDTRINYLAKMLQEKLIRLTDYTARLRDALLANLTNSKELNEQKITLYSISTDLQTLQLILQNNQLVSKVTNYHALEEQITNVTHKLDELLYIINNMILNEGDLKLNNEYLQNKITSALESQEMLYTMFYYTYQDTIAELAE
ncbi:MAG TPA: hypothetical protein ENK82_03035, partial [Campylobacterales bacterium]|nr:hypothetical protein [Campylobacterales bacterium]